MSDEAKISDKKIESEALRLGRDEILGEIARLRASADALLEKAKRLWWSPREYLAKFQHYETRQAGDQYEVVTPRQDGLIEPGVLVVFEFGGDYVEPGSVYPGLPETGRRWFAVENPFNVQKLEIDDEDAPHFVIEGFSVGAKSVFGGIMAGSGVQVLMTRFAASATPKIVINEYVHAGTAAKLVVRNISDSPKAFRTKLVGVESKPEDK